MYFTNYCTIQGIVSVVHYIYKVKYIIYSHILYTMKFISTLLVKVQYIFK